MTLSPMFSILCVIVGRDKGISATALLNFCPLHPKTFKMSAQHSGMNSPSENGRQFIVRQHKMRGSVGFFKHFHCY